MEWLGKPRTWAEARGKGERIKSLESFKSGFSLQVPLTDTTIYLDYLAVRFRKAAAK